MQIVIIFLILILIVGIGLGALHIFNSSKGGQFTGYAPGKSNAQKQADLANNAFLPQLSWGQFTPNTTPDGQCLNYTAPAARYEPGRPSYSDLQQGSGAGYLITNQSCTDIDQILAQAGSHTCQNPDSGSAGTGCYLTVDTPVDGIVVKAGTKVKVGVVEGVYPNTGSTYPYFVPCGIGNNAVGNGQTTSNQYCTGNIGLVVPRFAPQKVFNESDLCGVPGSSDLENMCLAFDFQNTNTDNRKHFAVKTDPCNLGQFYQIFRIVRYTLNSDYTFTQDDNGKFASITYRLNGFYLAPDMEFTTNTTFNGNVPTITSYTYAFDKPIIDVALSEKLLIPTIGLQLINPADDQVRNGVYWLLQDQTTNTEYDVATIPPQQYYGCPIYPHLNNQGQYKDCPLSGLPDFYSPLVPPNPDINPSYLANAPVSPQQFVFIPNLYELPTDPTDLSGLWSYLITQYSLNLSYDPKILPPDPSLDNIPVLQPFRTEIPVEIQFETCNPGSIPLNTIVDTCVKTYKNTISAGILPIMTVRYDAISNRSEYQDSQFISYNDIINANVKGISTLSAGCSVLSSNPSGNKYNPFSSSDNPLISTVSKTN
jgi:hypothetical protein